MSEDWGAVAAEVRDAFAEVGFQALLKKPGGTVPDPDTPPQNPFPDPNAPPDPDPADPPEAPDPLSVWAMFDKFTAKHHEKWDVRATDVLVIVEAVAAQPTQGDTLSIDGKDYAIVTASAEGPGFPAVMYECQCRR